MWNKETHNKDLTYFIFIVVILILATRTYSKSRKLTKFTIIVLYMIHSRC